MARAEWSAIRIWRANLGAEGSTQARGDELHGISLADGYGRRRRGHLRLYQYTVPAISGAAFQGPDFRLQCCGLPNSTYTVQVSTNLLNWSDLNSFISDTNGLFDCADAAQIHCDRRFYRLKYTAP